MSRVLSKSTWLWLLLLGACLRPPATLDRLVVSPESGRVAQGDTLRYSALGLYSDGSTKVMTGQVAWLVDDALVARPDAAAPGVVQGVRPGSTVVRARYDGVSASRPLTVTAGTLRLLQVYPPRPVAPLGLAVQLQVIAVHTDQTIENVTAEAVWMPGDASLFTVTAGRLVGRAPGTADLAVSWGGGITHVQVTVTSASVTHLDVQPGAFSLPAGLGQPLTATATLTDGSTLDVTAAASWSSSAPATAFVNTGSTSPGLVTGRAPGDATITAAVGSASATSAAHVTSAVLTQVVLAPAAPSAALGTSVDLTATGLFSDGSSRDVTAQATWVVETAAVATLDGSVPGRVHTLAVGSTAVRASLSGKTGSETLTVSAAIPTGLEVAPASRALALGTSQTFTATATFSDGTRQDVSSQVVWTAADATVASISNAAGSQGRALALALGTTTVTAELGSLRGQATVRVTAAVLASLQVTPSAPSLPLGAVVQLTATGVFSDATTQDLSAQVTWASATPAVATVSNAAGSQGQVRGAATGSAVVSATLSGITGSATVTVSPAVLVSLSLAPSPLVLARGTRASLGAVGLYSDGSTRSLTTQVTWTSGDGAVASVSNATGHEGEVLGVATGATTVRAQLGSVSATVPVTVTPAVLTALEVTPAAPTLAAGLTLPFHALGTWSDQSTRDVTTQVTWASGAPAVASVSNAAGSEGLARAASPGTTLISATLSGVTGSTTLTVTPALLTALAVSPPSLSLTRGSGARLAVRGTYSDGASIDLTTQVTWTSSDAATASVSNAAGSEGQVQAVAVGSATITARLGAVSGTSSVTVTPATLQAVEVTPLSPSVALGTTQAFAATGRYSDGTTQDLTATAGWSVADPVVASVSNAVGSAGVALGLHQGSTVVTARSGAFQGTATLTVTVAALQSIAISPASPRLAQLTGLDLHATGRWTDGSTQDLTTQVTWGSSDGAVATLSNAAGTQGHLFGAGPGTATVTATFSGVTGSTVATITNATLLSLALTPASPSAPVGLGVQLTATGTFSDGSTQDLTPAAAWSSSDASRASVSGGRVTAVAVGSADVSATALGVTGTVTFTSTPAALVALDVNPAAVTLPLGRTQAFTASGTFTDGSTADVTAAVTWSSGTPAVAQVSNAAGSHGVASALAVGQASITASLAGRYASATLTVTPAALVSLAVTPVNPSLPVGLTQALTATATYTDGSTLDVTALATWSSGAPGVATVSNAAGSHGLATAVGVGSATVSAAVGAVSGGTTLTVTPAQLVSVGLTPVNPVVPKGLTVQLRLTGVYTDGSSQDLTGSAVWSSDDASVAPVSNAAGSQGLVTALAQGSATVGAAAGGKSASTLVTVSAAVLQSLQVTPQPASTPAGLTVQLTATGVYSDASLQDLTAVATWSTSAAGVAAVSNSAGSEGRVTGVSVGSATVTATRAGVQGSTLVTVSPAVLQSVQVTPANTSRPKGIGLDFTATGLYSDGSLRDLTATAQWTSSDALKVSVSNAAGSAGHASTLGVGTVTITATQAGIPGTTPFTVTAAVLTGVALTPANATVPLGSVRQLVATGTYSDGSTQNLTSSASWASSDSTVVSVSNAVGSKGLASSLATGTVTLSTSTGGFTATTAMSVTQAALASIDLTPSGGSTALGYTRQFIAIGNYTDGTTQVLTTQVTWASSDGLVAFISNAGGSKGLLTPVATGAVTVSATYAGVTGSTLHTISPAVLLSVAVAPGTTTVAPMGTVQLTATGSFSDGSFQDLTATVVWSSSAPAVAQVSNAAGSQGLVTGIAPGPATVTATSGSHAGTAAVTVP